MWQLYIAIVSCQPDMRVFIHDLRSVIKQEREQFVGFDSDLYREKFVAQ
jgi:hypothetical protein